MHIRRRLVGSAALFTVVAGLLAAPAAPASAAEIPRPLVTGWLPYWSAASSAAVLTANKDLFTEGSSFAFSATGATTIVSKGDATGRATVLNATHAAGLRAVATVTDGMAAHQMAAVLANASTRAQLVATLTNLTSAGYDGVDLDFEKFAFSDGSSTWSSTRPNWVAFVAQLASALHARGRLLTATVPVEYDPALGQGSGYWVYDYKGIAPYVDKLRIMAYDYSVSAAGPIAPLPWVSQVVAWAVTQIPASKIEIGVPTYGRDWVTATYGICPVDNPPQRRSYTAATAIALAASKHVTPTWNATYAERTFVYGEKLSGVSATGAPASCTVSRTVWYDDASAVMARAALVGKYNLAGIALWTIGGEDPAQWAALRAYAVHLYAKSLPIGHVDAVTVSPGALEVRGWTLARITSDPIWALVDVGSSRSLVAASLPRSDVARAYPAYGPAHGFDQKLTVSPGVHNVCVYGLGNGLSTRLWCGRVTVPPVPTQPFGHVDQVVLGPGSITVNGWVIDPNTTGPTRAQLNVDAGYQVAPADVSRPDVGLAYPAFGPLHGFSITAHVSAGRHTLCVYGKNVGPGSDTTLACRTVTVP